MLVLWLVRIVLGEYACESDRAGIDVQLGAPTWVEIGQGGINDAAFELGEGGVMLWTPGPPGLFLGEYSQRLDYGRKVGNEAAAVTRQAK